MNRPADSKRLTLPAAFASAFFLGLVIAAVLARGPQTERSAARRESGSGAPASTGRTSAAERDPAAPTIETPAGRYRPGDLLRYRFESRSSASADFNAGLETSAAPVPAVPIASTLRGTITVKVYDAADEGWVLGFELSGLQASVAAGTVSAPESAARLAALMTTEVLASCERSGRLQGLRFSPGTTPEAKDLVRALIARMQVVLPGDASKKEWEVVEDDPTGRCLVHYARLEDAEGVVLAKRKERYVETFHRGGFDPAAATMTVDGETRVHLREELPVRIAGNEAVLLEGPGIAGTLTVTEDIEINLESSSRSPRLAMEGRGLRRRLQASGWESFAPESLPGQAQAAGADVNIVSELAGLEALLGSGERSTPEVIARFEAIVHLVRSQPDAAAAVLAFLREQEEDAGLWQMLAGALGAAGSETAQAALEEVITAPGWPEAWRGTALMALAQVEEPVERLDALLKSLHREGGDLAMNALLVLGVHGQRVSAADPERHERIQDYLLEAAREAAGAPAAVVALEALGNLAPAATPASVLRAYHEGEDIVRASALRAVRQTFDSAADSLLQAALAGDPAEDVRLAAASVLAGRDPNAKVLRHAILNDPSERVRGRAVSEVARLGAGSDARGLIEWVAQNDGSEDVRARARGILDRGAAPGHGR